MKHGLDSIFVDVAANEKWKMKSNMYKVNSKLIQLLTENLVERNLTVKGYLPMNKEMQQEPAIRETGLPTAIDGLKEHYLLKFIQLCKQKGVSLVFYASPSYRKTLDYQFDYIKKLSDKEGIRFINHYCDNSFVQERGYFYDSVHMNQRGATAYSSVVAVELRDSLDIF